MTMFILGFIIAYFILGLTYLLAEIFGHYADSGSVLMFYILCFWVKPIELIIRFVYRAYLKNKESADK